MPSPVALCCLLNGLLMGQVWGKPVSNTLKSDYDSLTQEPDLAFRLNDLHKHLYDPRLHDMQLPMPSASDMEIIKKVAKILVLLRQQPNPLEPLPLESLFLSPESELAFRLDSLHSQLQNPLLQNVHVQLPTSKDIETIRKVAHILGLLGQQVIPAIIGEPSHHPGGCHPASSGDEVPQRSWQY